MRRFGDFFAGVERRLRDAGRLAVVERVMALEPRPLPELSAILRELSEEVRVPFAAATLLDDRDQRFLATAGVPAGMELPVDPVEGSHCQYVIASGSFLCVSDARVDPMWRRLTRVMVGGAPLVAYAGFPLRVSGELMGSVCVVDMVPRSWSPDELFAVYGAARRAGDVLDGALTG